MIQTLNINNIWNDPVWSKVISWIIILVITQIFVLIWSLIKRIRFIQVYVNIYKSITEFSSRESKKSKDKKETKPTEIRDAPTVFFHHRFCDAFPGMERDVLWVTKKREINNRLKILLKEPTKFDIADGHGLTTDPVWWFRGGSALYIKSFKILNRNKVVINSDEYRIEKIAAYRGSNYYRDFVYIQCYADKPTGLYKYSKDYLNTFINEDNDYKEAFGLYKGRKITSQEYDDGATIKRGKPIRIEGAEFRTRTLTKYNFIIAAKFSPYNCNEFYWNSKEYFGKLLREEIEFDVFVDWMNQFEKNHNDY